VNYDGSRFIPDSENPFSSLDPLDDFTIDANVEHLDFHLEDDLNKIFAFAYHFY
jgi:hypothetical protein